MENIHARILRSEEALAAWDRRNPDKRPWFERIPRLNKLDMKMVGNCLLGQLFEDFLAGLEELRISPQEASDPYAFALPRLSGYSALTELWSNRIYLHLGEKISGILRQHNCELTGFTPFTVGTQGDDRAYQPGVYVRFPSAMNMEERGRISNELINKVKGITRVLMEIETT